MLFVYGLLAATGAIITAELVGNYGLGDLLKDAVLHVVRGAEYAATNAVRRFENRVAKIKKVL